MENGKPHYCEACHQTTIAENIKLQEEIRDLKKENEELKKVNKIGEDNFNNAIKYKNNIIDELRSNKNGVLKTIKHIERQIIKTPFPSEKQELSKSYLDLVKLYNCIDDKDLQRKITCRLI